MKKATFIAISFLLLTSTLYGQTNVLSGAGAGLLLNTTGINNVFTGVRAGEFSTAANKNVFTGFEAGRYNTIGSDNIFAGFQAGLNNTESNNVFVGTAAGRSNTKSFNVFVGSQAGMYGVSGFNNVFMGHKAGLSSAGSRNVFLGFLSGYQIGTGVGNVFVGSDTGANVFGGSNNTFVGANAGSNSVGNSCVFLGNSAGTNVTGSNKLYIDNSNTPTPLIYGDFADNQLGINTTTIPNGFALAVDGNVTIGGTNGGTVLATIFKKTGASSGEFLMADGTTTTLAAMGITSNTIQNQNSAEQSANMWINGTGIFGGNVGIGTNDPKGKLDVVGALANVSLSPNSPATANFRTANTVQLAISSAGIAPFTTSLQAKHTSLDNMGSFPIALNPLGGNVGIGITEPSSPLHVSGKTQITDGIANADTALYATFGVTRTNAIDPLAYIAMTKAGTVVKAMGIDKDNNWVFGQPEATTQYITAPQMAITPSGKVGIGITNPVDQLEVNGTIHAKEVRVDLTNWGPDYVFQKYYTGKSELKADYTMPTLAEIESFTKKNHHLPNVPSAKEIKQNGLQLGDISIVLLQKVEELTLYLIQQNKEIEQLKAQLREVVKKQ